MSQVFAIVSYDIFNMPGFFSQFYDYVGHFQIQQSIQQSYNKVFELWFYTDEISIMEGDSRAVEISCTRYGQSEKIYFQITTV